MIYACGNPRIQHQAIAGQPEPLHLAPRRRLRQSRGEGPLELHHLERAHNAPAVGGQDGSGCGRVEASEARVERFGPHLGEFRLESCAHLRVRAREVHLVKDRLHVEPGAPHDDDSAPAGFDVLDTRPRPIPELHHAHLMVDAPHVQHVVGYAASLGFGHFRGADIHPDVDLHGVRAHDLAADPLGDINR